MVENTTLSFNVTFMKQFAVTVGVMWWFSDGKLLCLKMHTVYELTGSVLKYRRCNMMFWHRLNIHSFHCPVCGKYAKILLL